MRKQVNPKINASTPLPFQAKELLITAFIPGELTDSGKPELEVICNLCHLSSTIPAKNIWSRNGCGCTRKNRVDIFAATEHEKVLLDTITARWLADNSMYVPIHLREHWRPRQLEPGWHPDNPDRYSNFIKDVGHKKLKGSKEGEVFYGFLDPAGDFTAQNFYWKDDPKDHQGSNRKTSSKRKGRKEEGEGPSTS